MTVEVLEGGDIYLAEGAPVSLTGVRADTPVPETDCLFDLSFLNTLLARLMNLLRPCLSSESPDPAGAGVLMSAVGRSLRLQSPVGEQALTYRYI